MSEAICELQKVTNCQPRLSSLRSSQERVNVKENGCNLDSGNADVVMRWANGEDSWEDVVEISGRMEGDVARVIMRTADMLKQLDNKGWEVAGDARRRIIRGEVEEFYYGV